MSPACSSSFSNVGSHSGTNPASLSPAIESSGSVDRSNCQTLRWFFCGSKGQEVYQLTDRWNTSKLPIRVVNRWATYCNKTFNSIYGHYREFSMQLAYLYMVLLHGTGQYSDISKTATNPKWRQVKMVINIGQSSDKYWSKLLPILVGLICMVSSPACILHQQGDAVCTFQRKCVR